MNNSINIDIREYASKLEQFHLGIISALEWRDYCRSIKDSILIDDLNHQKINSNEINIYMAKGNNARRKEVKKPKKDKPIKKK